MANTMARIGILFSKKYNSFQILKLNQGPIILVVLEDSEIACGLQVGFY